MRISLLFGLITMSACCDATTKLKVGDYAISGDVDGSTEMGFITLVSDDGEIRGLRTKKPDGNYLVTGNCRYFHKVSAANDNTQDK